MEQKKRNPYFYPLVAVLLFVVLPVAACIVVFVNPFRVPDRLQVLDSCRDTNDGLLLLTQSYNGSLIEPSSIMVFQRNTNNQWVRYYIDHEAPYWWSGKLVKKGGKYEVSCESQPVAEVDAPKQVIRATAGKSIVRESEPITGQSGGIYEQLNKLAKTL
ncbi:MAG: hypothetical protein ABFD69_05175 [Candidatus Sumerlaeia bacterium]